MDIIYVLSERHNAEKSWRIIGAVVDFKVASAWLDENKNGRASILHKWERVSFNSPELLNRISRGKVDDNS